ncbi:MAG: type II secretion system F domain-containing protein [Methanolobus sp. T82-4]|nr:type II secretion system F family protein [Methanolobus zinderi]KXS40624.1 MAG: type II secretion system F domain-containing protein [Methanolobus sp. T82-4]
MNGFDYVAHRIFGEYIRERIDDLESTRIILRKANMGMLVEQYISQACLVSAITGILAALVGIFIGLYFFRDIALYNIGTWIVPAWISSNFANIFALLLSITFLVVATSLTYYIFMSIPQVQANVRSSLINQSLPHTTAYLYALSRGGGLNLLDIMRSITENYHIYGAAAEEIGYIVKDMDCYGTDLLTALEKATIRTPSQKFKDFIEGLESIVASGGDITAYLKAKNDQYRLTATKEQKIFFETLGVLAEVYISAFVAGPLFLITILVVLGLVNSGSIAILNFIIYIVIPISTVIFVLLLSSITGENANFQNIYVREKKLDVFSHVRIRAGPENEDELRKKMRFYENFIKVRNTVFHPFHFLKSRPSYVFAISLPLALLYLLFTVQDYINSFNLTAFKTINTAKLAVIDDHVFMALLILFVPFVIFDEIRNHRVKQIESHIPEFLKNLASINEAGIMLVDAIEMSTKLKIGVLHAEVKRLVNDLSWGTKIDDALKKFEYRIRTDMTRRIITLIIKANEATSDIKSVLTIAAHDADVQKQLKKERNAEMFVYVFIIYIAFMVFLFIVYILAAYFLPAMPSGTNDIQAGMPLISEFDLEAYTMLFFHAAMIQGFCSGIVAGKMGSGKVYSGLKHSLLMMSIAYIIFTMFI